MSKHKKAKYISLVACLCLLFGVGLVGTSYARYSENESASSEIGIARFNVSAALYSDEYYTYEVTSLTIEDALDIPSYSETYYMKIENNGDINVSYSLTISEPFLINSEHALSGYIAAGSSESLTLNITTGEIDTPYEKDETATISLSLDVYQIDEIPNVGGGN